MPSSLSSIPPKRSLPTSTTSATSTKGSAANAPTSERKKSVVKKRPRIEDSEEEEEAWSSDEVRLSKTVKSSTAEKGKGKEKEKLQKPNKEKVKVKKRKSTGTNDSTSTAASSTSNTAPDASASRKNGSVTQSDVAQTRKKSQRDPYAVSDIDELESGAEDAGEEETEEAKAARLKKERKERKARKRAKREARESRAEEARLQAEADEKKRIQEEEDEMVTDENGGRNEETAARQGESETPSNGESAQQEIAKETVVKGFADDSDYEEEQEQQEPPASTIVVLPAQSTFKIPNPATNARTVSPSTQPDPASSSANLRQGIPILPSDPTQPRRSVPPPPPPPPAAAAAVASASSSPNPFAMPLSSSPPPVREAVKLSDLSRSRSRTSSLVESNGAIPVSPVVSPVIAGQHLSPQPSRQESATLSIETNQPQFRNDFPPSPAQSAPSPDFIARATPTPVASASAGSIPPQGAMDVDPPSRNNSPRPDSILSSRFPSVPLKASPIPLGHGRRSASPLAQTRTSQPPTPSTSTSTFRPPPRDKQPHQLSRSVSAAPQDSDTRQRELPFIRDDWSRHPRDGLNVFEEKEKAEIEKMCRVHKGVVLEQKFAFSTESELVSKVEFEVGFRNFRNQLSQPVVGTLTRGAGALPVRARLVFRSLEREARTSKWPILFQVHLNDRTVRTYNRLAGKPILSYQALDITSLLDLTGSNTLTLARWPQDSLPPSLSISIELYSVFTRQAASAWIQAAQAGARDSKLEPDAEPLYTGHDAHLHHLSVDTVIRDNFPEGCWKCPSCDEHLLDEALPMTKDGAMVFDLF